MKCPYCGSFKSKVVDSRPTEDGERIRTALESYAKNGVYLQHLLHCKG